MLARALHASRPSPRRNMILTSSFSRKKLAVRVARPPEQRSCTPSKPTAEPPARVPLSLPTCWDKAAVELFHIQAALGPGNGLQKPFLACCCTEPANLVQAATTTAACGSIYRKSYIADSVNKCCLVQLTGPDQDLGFKMSQSFRWGKRTMLQVDLGVEQWLCKQRIPSNVSTPIADSEADLTK